MQHKLFHPRYLQLDRLNADTLTALGNYAFPGSDSAPNGKRYINTDQEQDDMNDATDDVLELWFPIARNMESDRTCGPVSVHELINAVYDIVCQHYGLPPDEICNEV